MFSQLFDIGKDVLFTSLDRVTNVIRAQLGDSVNGTVDSNGVDVWQQPGFSSRPAVPTQGKPACQAIVIKRGNRDCAIAMRDTRDSKIYGAMKDGETCVYASGSQSRTLWKADGSIWNVVTVGNAPGGTTYAIQQGADGSFTAQGPTWVIKADAAGNITIGNSACGITLGVDGKVHIFGTIVQAQASGVAMISGDIATCVGPKAVPLNPAGAAALGPGTPLNVPSTNVFVSP